MHAADSICRAAHWTYIRLFEANGHAFVRGQKHDAVPIGDAGGNQFIVFLDADGDDAARHDITEVLQRRFLHRTHTSRKEDVLVLLLEITHVENGAYTFARLQRD